MIRDKKAVMRFRNSTWLLICYLLHTKHNEGIVLSTFKSPQFTLSVRNTGYVRFMAFTQPPPVLPWFFFRYFLYTIVIKLPNMSNALRKAWHIVVTKSCYHCYYCYYFMCYKWCFMCRDHRDSKVWLGLASSIQCSRQGESLLCKASSILYFSF